MSEDLAPDLTVVDEYQFLGDEQRTRIRGDFGMAPNRVVFLMSKCRNTREVVAGGLWDMGGKSSLFRTQASRSPEKCCRNSLEKPWRSQGQRPLAGSSRGVESRHGADSFVCTVVKGGRPARQLGGIAEWILLSSLPNKGSGGKELGSCLGGVAIITAVWITLREQG